MGTTERTGDVRLSKSVLAVRRTPGWFMGYRHADKAVIDIVKSASGPGGLTFPGKRNVYIGRIGSCLA